VIIGADLRPVATRENQLDSAGTNPWFNFLQERPLPLLNREVLETMVSTLAGEMGVDDIEPGFTARLYDLTGGHPSLARTVAGEAYRQRSIRTRLTEPDLQAALDRLADNDELGYFVRSNLWQPMTVPERQILTALSGGRPPTVGGDELVQAEATLRRQGLIDGDRVCIGLLARWVAHRGPETGAP
jgi:hypothetical protein